MPRSPFDPPDSDLPISIPSGTFPSPNGRAIADQLQALADAIRTGAIGHYELSQTANSITLTVDSMDGTQRLIRSRDARPGLIREHETRIERQSADDRRQTVKRLVEEGLTQTEIARYTLRSQKTISNDIQRLKKDGELGTQKPAPTDARPPEQDDQPQA